MIGIYSAMLPISNKRADTSEFVGVQVACREFVKNLAQYSPAGDVGLFVSQAEVEQTRRALALLQSVDGGNTDTASVWEFEQIGEAIQQRDITAFHNILAPQLHILAYIRSKFASKPFPITALTHGFSVQPVLYEFFTRYLLTPTQPYDSIICTSNAAKCAFIKMIGHARESLEATGCRIPDRPCRFDVLPLGVDINNYQPQNRAIAVRQLGLPPNKVILLYFGRINHLTKADLNPLLLAFQNLVEKHGDQIVLLLAGNATPVEVVSIEAFCRRLGIADQVVLRPSPSLLEGPLYYAASDIFVGLSDTPQESFGLSILEAMASGLPVVVSDWSGYRETSEHGRTGFHVPTLWGKADDEVALFSPLINWKQDDLHLEQSISTDLHFLTHYLDLLVSNQDLRKGMGDAARQHCVSNYRWENVISQYWALWNELASIATSRQHPEYPSTLPMGDQPRYFEAFSHFPTRCLTTSDHLTITERGLHAAKTPQSMIIHDEMRGVLSQRAMIALLRFLRFRKSLKRSVTVDELVVPFGKRYHFSPSRLMAHILWLIKYGHMTAAQQT
ncbi:glycosyltransferase family 4 protein [Capsulimonas corticalis]|uniref:glycosyltransferase family 4 protein n=1 Tax=Capsulimonas corticalis TaxID=2219043 RepID=UPI000E6460DC|nr:glycosyltransferase family 4 protein [Capsulimonas corticalis]